MFQASFRSSHPMRMKANSCKVRLQEPKSLSIYVILNVIPCVYHTYTNIECSSYAQANPERQICLQWSFVTFIDRRVHGLFPQSSVQSIPTGNGIEST